MNEKNENKRQKTDKSVQISEITRKHLFDLIDDFDSDSSDSDIELEYFEDTSKWEYKEINKDIKDINDLIELGKMYDPKEKVRYNIDLYKLSKLVEPLEKLNSMIGLSNIKENIVGQIIYNMQNLDDNDDMMHTVIQGSPGVGKTMLGKILGDIYFNMGVIKGNKKRSRFGEEKYNFKIVKRSDLIGKYLGHTAVKTQKVIDSCQGGVLFIDEAYSLGNPEGRDTFSKENGIDSSFQ